MPTISATALFTVTLAPANTLVLPAIIATAMFTVTTNYTITTAFKPSGLVTFGPTLESGLLLPAIFNTTLTGPAVTITIAGATIPAGTLLLTPTLAPDQKLFLQIAGTTAIPFTPTVRQIHADLVFRVHVVKDAGFNVDVARQIKLQSDIT
jgi:hypothetical protein